MNKTWRRKFVAAAALWLLAFQNCSFVDFTAQQDEGVESVSNQTSGTPTPAPAPSALAELPPSPTPIPLSTSDLPKRPKFQVYNSMLYDGMPKLGLRPPTVYESRFYPENANHLLAPPDQGIAAAVADVQNQRSGYWMADAPLVVLDLEQWELWPWVSGATHEANVKKYAEVAKRMKAAMPGVPICYYSIMPHAGLHWLNFAAADPKIHATMMSENKVQQKYILPHVDALCPEIYTHYDSSDPVQHSARVEEWKNFARKTIQLAREIGEGRPVYPFVWPQYHSPGGNMPGYPFIVPDFWRAQLEIMRDEADGIILWGGWNFQNNSQLKWDPNAEWYRILKEVFPDVR